MAASNVIDIKIKLDNNEFRTNMKQAQDALKGLGVSTQGLSDKFKALSLTAKAAGIAIVGALAVGLYKAGDASLKAASKMEDYETSLKVMLGSLERAKFLLSELSEFADKTPFKLEDLAQGTQTLLQFGIAGNDVMETLKMLGDVSGGDVEKFKSLTLAFGQMSSAGRLMGQDLLQMINAGFNPLQVISEQTGKSMGQLKKEMEKGAISTEMVVAAFKKATSEGGRFYNLMEERSRTLSGKLSTLSDGWSRIAADIGALLLPAAKMAVDVLIKLTDWIKGAVRQIRIFFHEAAIGFKEMDIKIRDFLKLDTSQQRRELQLLKDELGFLKSGKEVDLGNGIKTPSGGGEFDEKAAEKARKEALRKALEANDLALREELAINDYTEAKILERKIYYAEQKRNILERFGEDTNESYVEILEAETALDNQHLADKKVIYDQDLEMFRRNLEIQSEEEEEALNRSRDRWEGYFNVLLNRNMSWADKMRQIAQSVAMQQLSDAVGMAASAASGSGFGGILGSLGKALLSFDTGGVIPGSFSQPVPITAHGSEMVLNPSQQSRLWNTIQNGGGAGGGQPVIVHTSFTINAIDGRSVERMLAEKREFINGMVADGIRKGGGLKAAVRGA